MSWDLGLRPSSLGFHLALAASWTPTSPAPCLLDSHLLAVSSVDSLPAFGSQVSVEGGWPSRGSLGRRLLGRGSLRGLVSASWDLGLRPSGKGGDRLDRLEVKKRIRI